MSQLAANDNRRAPVDVVGPYVLCFLFGAGIAITIILAIALGGGR